MRKPDPVEIDHKLIADAQRYAGAAIHDVSYSVMCYEHGAMLWNRTGAEVWFEIFKRHELILRQFVIKSRTAEAIIDRTPALGAN